MIEIVGNQLTVCTRARWSREDVNVEVRVERKDADPEGSSTRGNSLLKVPKLHLIDRPSNCVSASKSPAKGLDPHRRKLSNHTSKSSGQGCNKIKAQGASTQSANMTITDIVTDPFLQSVLQTSSLTRQQCMNLLDLVEAHPTPPGTLPPHEIQLQLSKQQKILYTYLAHPRGDTLSLSAMSVSDGMDFWVLGLVHRRTRKVKKVLLNGKATGWSSGCGIHFDGLREL